MNKRERAYARKRAIISAMCATAEANGKPSNWFDMFALANRLYRLETTLSRLAEEYGYPVYDEAKQKRIEELAEKLITENIGCKCFTRRDPRGYCIRMYLVDEQNHKWCNTWDGETTGLAW